MSDGHLFSNILIGGRGGTNPGQLRVHSGGVAWKKQGGGKVVDINKDEITGAAWMKVPRGYQLSVRVKDGLCYKFIGFREQDVGNLISFIQKTFGITTEEKQLAVSGQNWGDVDISGNMLTFMVGSKQAFEVCLADVAQTQLQGKTDVYLELHVDDTTAANEGLIHEVFAVVLRGLSGAKVTRPGKFRSSHDGFAVKSSLKAEDGLLYPLEKGFFFLPKPPTLILHDEIDWVEFERHGAGSTSVHYFDLFVKLKSEQDYLFRNIQKSEYSNLFNFISGKGLKILNLGEGKHANGEPQEMEDEDDAVDPHLARIQSAAADDESDEEDEDFVADKDDGGSPTDDSDAIESGSDSERKNSPAAPRTAPKRRSKEGNEEEKRKRRAKKTKKKDPDAPKRAMSGFMFFSNSERDNIKKANPAMAFTDLGRALGERWNKMTADEKEPYESLSRADQKRYKAAMAGYRSAADGEPRGKI